MKKPLLIVVTGRPASGKSTLAVAIANAIKCPLISRDALKEGYLNTLGVHHHQLDNSAAMHIYHSFFAVIDLLVLKEISVVIEAAFQDKLWRPQLEILKEKAQVKIIICELPTELAKERFTHRLQADPGRDQFHGDGSVKEQGGLSTSDYDPVRMDVPTLHVDTTKRYVPGIKEILDFIRDEKKN